MEFCYQKDFFRKEARIVKLRFVVTYNKIKMRGENMKRQISILVMLLLCVMTVGGCKSSTNEKTAPEATEVVSTPIATKLEKEQTEETKEPKEEEKDKNGQTDAQVTKEPKNNEQTKENLSDKKDYKVVLKKEKGSSKGTFQVTYPQIEGWSDQKSMKYWNELFAAANYGQDDGVDAYTLKTKVMTQSEELLSILMEGSIQYEGISETSKFAYTYNINMKTGKSYRLGDSKANLSEIEDKLMNEDYNIVTKNQNVSMVAVLDTLYLKNEKDDDVARVKEALKECDFSEDNTNAACYSYWKNGKVGLVFNVDEEIGGYSIFELK